MAEIIVYTKEGCGFSASLRERSTSGDQPLPRRGRAHAAGREDRDARAPAGSIGTLIGGFDETLAADRSGRLAELLAA